MLGAYVLDLLSDDEATGVRAHVDGCVACAAQLQELADLPAALRRVDPDRPGDQPQPPRDLGERISATLAAETRAARRVRSSRWAALAAALSAVLAVAVVTTVSRPPAPAPRETVALVDVTPGIEADAELIAHTWGTEVILVASGLVHGGTYVVTFQDSAGRDFLAGSFLGVGDKPVVCRLNAALLREAAAGFTVTTSAGEPVLRARL